jgi:hypothetical protein
MSEQRPWQQIEDANKTHNIVIGMTGVRGIRDIVEAPGVYARTAENSQTV